MTPFPPARHRTAGVTLMELLVALATVSILAAIIIPSYRTQVQKSRRSDAKNALLDLAAREERYFATNNSYTATAANLGYGSTATFPISVGSNGTGAYSLNVTAASTTSFTALATRSGPQLNDACGDYQLNDQGQQSNPNIATSVTTATCW